MEKHGLIAECLATLNNTWITEELLKSTAEQRASDASLEDSLFVFKKIAKTRNLPLIMETEQIVLFHELKLYANSPEEKNSIEMALKQLAEAIKATSVVHNFFTYQEAAKTYSSKRMEEGLPLDSCREFLKSHATRLTNRLVAPLSVPKKNILRQRKENLKIVKELYIELQREALGLSTKKKEKGLVQ